MALSADSPLRRVDIGARYRSGASCVAPRL